MIFSDSYEDIATRANANLNRGNYAAALEGYERLSKRLSSLSPVVLKRRPALRDLLALSLIRQANVHHWRGEFEPALQLYQQLMDLAPESRDDWQVSMALVRIDMGQAEAGLDELRALAVARPGSLLWQTIGMECDALGRLDEAEESLRRAVQLAADADSRREAYLSLFDFYRARNRIDEALAAWQQAWAGQQPEYVFPLYQMMHEAGDLRRAHEYLDQESNPLRKGFYQGLFAADEGKADEAAKHWKRVARMDPLKYDEGQDAWAEAALRTDVPAQEVIAALNAVSQAKGLSVHGIVLQATAEARIGHADHAREALGMACNVGLQSRPRQEKLSATHWALLDELVPDATLKSQLRDYFEASAA
jgi:tetratricopeptide (TPR) repeat protein